jgi:DNA-binding NarL/FixJ family response regulator
MQHFDSSEELMAFRQAVFQASVAELRPSDARCFWQDLLSGRRSAIDAFDTSERSYLTLISEEHRAPFSAQSGEMLGSFLLGKAAKELAFEFGLSQSTVAGRLKQSLARLGLSGVPSKAPLSLATLAQAAAYPELAAHLGVYVSTFRGRECHVLVTRLPALGGLLTPAVEAVVHLHVQGRSHAEIAERRQISQRTVANQLATAFQRLGVSGRTGLLDYLAGHRPCPSLSRA